MNIMKDSYTYPSVSISIYSLLTQLSQKKTEKADVAPVRSLEMDGLLGRTVDLAFAGPSMGKIRKTKQEKEGVILSLIEFCMHFLLEKKE